MSYLKVHFDGRVLVPEEPVNLPRNESFEVIIPDSMQDLSAKVRGSSSDLPYFAVPSDAEPLTSEQVREAQDE